VPVGYQAVSQMGSNKARPASHQYHHRAHSKALINPQNSHKHLLTPLSQMVTKLIIPSSLVQARPAPLKSPLPRLNLIPKRYLVLMFLDFCLHFAYNGTAAGLVDSKL
jgi:hypothetical protein